MMHMWGSLVLVILAGGCFALLRRRQTRAQKSTTPTQAKHQQSGAWPLGWRYNLTQREQVFFRHLLKALPECFLFPHQGLQYVLHPTIDTSDAERLEAVSKKYAGLFVDIVV